MIEAGGVLDARGPSWTDAGGGWFIADGGTIRIKSGGILRLTYAGQVVARNGGRIILEDGAQLQLWGGEEGNGQGAISISSGGRLSIEGTYNLTGTGYFRFSGSAQINGPGDFIISGLSQDSKRLELDGANLELDPGQNLSISNARVMSGHGSVYLTQAGLSVQNVLFDGAGSYVLGTDGLGRSGVLDSRFIGISGIDLACPDPASLQPFIVSNCSFEGGNTGVGISTYAPTVVPANRPRIESCSFTDCDAGVRVVQMASSFIEDCNFTGQFSRGISASNSEVVSVRNCQVQGAQRFQNVGIFADQNTTVGVSGGRYAGCVEGINSDNSTIDLNNCVEIADNEFGVVTNTSTIRLGGARIIDNFLGISGSFSTLTRPAFSNGVLVRNTFGMSNGSASFLELRFANGNPLPRLNLTNCRWEINGHVVIPTDLWFCLFQQNNFCNRGFVDFLPTVDGGCGTDPGTGGGGPISNCGFDVPEDECFTGGGGGTATSLIILAPNPSHTGVTVAQLPSLGGELIVLDALGRVMLRQIFAEHQYSLELSVSDMPSGSYWLHLTDVAGEHQQLALVVQH